MTFKDESARSQNIVLIAPSELGKRIGTNKFNAEMLFSELLRPHFKSFGSSQAQIDGVYFPDLTKKKEGNFTVIDFTNTRAVGLNLETLFAVSACLQGARSSVAAKSDRWGVEGGMRPLRYEESFRSSLITWINKAGKVASRVSFTDNNKRNFYIAMSEMMNIVLKGNKPSEAFNYFMDADKNNRGFNLFKKFFPHIASKIDQEGIFILLNQKYKFEEIIRGFIENKPSNFYDIDTAIELAFLLQYPAEAINTLINLQKKHRHIEINWSSSKETVISLLNKVDKEGSLHKEVKEIESNLPTPKEFGMNINELETQLLREYFGRKDAIVISPEQIRKNPENFWKYQRALVLKIAENLGVAHSENDHIRPPKNYDSNRAASFRKTEKLLKENSDWAWLLLYPEIQKKFFENLPYLAVPPYVIIAGKAVPATDIKREREIIRNVKELGQMIVNRLPFLNFIDISPRKNNDVIKREHNLTIPGELIRKISLKKTDGGEGGFVYLDHGIARWLYGVWGENFTLDPVGYAAHGSMAFLKKATVDVDMMIFSVKKALGEIGREVVDKLNSNTAGILISNTMLGLSMGKIDWTFIAKDSGERSFNKIKNNAYMLAHSDSCITQALRGWQAGSPRQVTDLLVETLVGFSKIRTFGLLPELLRDSDGTEFFAVKPIDIFGGLNDYVEGGGGVELNGKRRNIVRFLSLERAFSDESVWLALRTIGDLIYTKGGAILQPEQVLDIADKKEVGLDSIFGAVSQFRQVLYPVYEHVEALRANKGTPQLSDNVKIDLRREIIKSAQELIEHDPVKFLTVCSDENMFNSQELLFGLELSRLYPHLNLLRKDSRVWKNIINVVSTLEKSPGESGMHFIARAILKIQSDPSIIEITAHSIREEFRRNPLRTAKKLADYSKEGQRQQAIIDNGLDTMANWALLDPFGLNTHVNGTNTHMWLALINYLETGTIDITKPLMETTNIFKVLETLKFHWNFTPVVSRIRFPAGQTLIGKTTEDQINAMADWLIDPGF